MTEPCGSKDEIHKVSEKVAVAVNRLTMIEQGRVVDKQTLDIFMGDMRSATRTLEDFVIEGREQLRQGDKKFELLFQSKRDLSNRISEVEAHVENDIRHQAAACVVRQTEFIEKQFNPVKQQVKDLRDDKIRRDERGVIVKSLPAIFAGVAVLAAFWDKIIHLFKGN